MPVAAIEKISEQKSFGGVQGFYRHASVACAGPMRFTVYQPPQAQRGRVPVLFWLSGLTCTEENFTIKAGAQRIAAELGLIVVAPDTSPRNTGIPPPRAKPRSRVFSVPTARLGNSMTRRNSCSGKNFRARS